MNRINRITRMKLKLNLHKIKIETTHSFLSTCREISSKVKANPAHHILGSGHAKDLSIQGSYAYYLHIQIQDDAPNANGRVSEVFSFYSIVGDQNTPLVPIDLENNDEWQSEKTWRWDCLWEECFVRVKILEKEEHADPDNPNYVFPEDYPYEPIEERKSETIIVQDMDENGNHTFPNSPGTYYIYLQVSDGNGNESDVISRYAKIGGTFRSKWETTSSNDTIHLPLGKGSNSGGTGAQMQYDFKLNCEYDKNKTDADQTLPWKEVTSWNDRREIPPKVVGQSLGNSLLVG